MPTRQPFDLAHWRSKLQSHPSKEFAEYILDGVQNGFPIGHAGETPTGATRNHPVEEVSKVNSITDWLFKGVDNGYILGPFAEHEVPVKNLIVSPLGQVPKDKHNPADPRVRPIHDLSAPKQREGRPTTGLSVNDSLQRPMCTATYVWFVEIVRLANEVGKDGYLWVIDAADAYLRVPVREEDWWLLGICWFDQYFIMTCLPFGLASAPKIYTAFADAIEWMTICSDFQLFMSDQGVQLIRHYLDDFFGGSPDKAMALRQFETVEKAMTDAAIPTRASKMEPPAHGQKIIGTLFDTHTQTITLPEDKCVRYAQHIREICDSSSNNYTPRPTKKRLQKLVGELRFAARHIWCGKANVRDLEILKDSLEFDFEHTRVRKDIRMRLMWFIHVLEALQVGISFEFILHPRKACQWRSTTDAFVNSREAGVGGYNCQGDWYQCRVDIQKEFGSAKAPDINWFELVAIVIAIRLWSHYWRSSSVLLESDNSLSSPVAQAILHTRKTGYPPLNLTRNRYFCAR